MTSLRRTFQYRPYSLKGLPMECIWRFLNKSPRSMAAEIAYTGFYWIKWEFRITFLLEEEYNELVLCFFPYILLFFFSKEISNDNNILRKHFETWTFKRLITFRLNNFLFHLPLFLFLDSRFFLMEIVRYFY